MKIKNYTSLRSIGDWVILGFEFLRYLLGVGLLLEPRYLHTKNINSYLLEIDQNVAYDCMKVAYDGGVSMYNAFESL